MTTEVHFQLPCQTPPPGTPDDACLNLPPEKSIQDLLDAKVRYNLVFEDIMLKARAVCVKCETTVTMEFTLAQYYNWKYGGFMIQVAMPQLKYDKREILMSNVCGACYDKLFQEYEF